MIPVELSRIVIRDISDQQYIFVREINGDRSFPIVIGIAEAMEIQRKVAGIATPRPMTHDLIRLLLEGLDAVIRQVVIDDLREGTFYAKLYLEHQGRDIRVDCRPSDAIALTAATDVPLFVEESVMDAVARDDEEESGEDEGETGQGGEDLF